jgi:hypothetical protein
VPPDPGDRPVAVPGTERPAGEGAAPEDLPAATAAPSRCCGTGSWPGLTPAEREVVRRLIALLDPVGETRVSRRHRRRTGAASTRAGTVRSMLRRGGEPVRWCAGPGGRGPGGWC